MAEPANHSRKLVLWKPWSWPLHWQILLGLVIGAVVGIAMGIDAVAQIPADTPAVRRGAVGAEIVRGTALFAIVELLGDLFLRALFVIIIPMITTSIILAVARVGAERDFARLGVKTLTFYLVTTLVATLTGLLLVNVFTPGLANGTGILEGQDLSAFQGAQQEVAKRVEGRALADFLNVFRDMVPDNIVSASVEGNFLGLITFSLVVGFFIPRLASGKRETFQTFIEAAYDLTMMVTDRVLKLAPFGVLFLIARTFSEQYAKLWPDGRFAAFISGMGSFAGITLFGLLFHFIVTMGLVLLVLGRVNPLRHYRAMAPALITAFSTASSSATMPLTLECVEKRAGVSNRVGGFTIPLGATVNMNGTALYECVSAIFICQAFGVHLSFVQQLLIVVIALLTSVGVAGVPSASLVAIAIILRTVQGQLPPEQAVNLMLGMGLLFVFDRPLDMVRTAVNIFGDSVAAVVIAKSEGETGVLAAPVRNGHS